MRKVAASVLALVVLAGCTLADRVEGGSSSTGTPPSVVPSDEPATVAKASVVKVHVDAPTCATRPDRTGFVVAPHRVMTVAHGVAGAEAVSVELGGTERKAQVVSFDPRVDIAILDVAELDATPVTFAESPSPDDADALLLVDRDGSVVTAAAHVHETIELQGPDIYRSAIVQREVYTFQSTVKDGDGGSPLIDLDGRVLGMTIGSALDDDEWGFALTAKEIVPQVGAVVSRVPVATGSCVR